MEEPQSEAVREGRSTPGAPPAGEPAPTLFAGKLLFWLPIAPLVALDLWSKAWAFAFVAKRGQSGGEFSIHNRVDVFEFAWVKFQLVTWLNRGTIWGLGDQFHFGLKFLRVGALALIVYFLYRTPAKRRWLIFSLGLILSGAIGNLYDNFFNFDAAYSTDPRYAGAVRDFIHFYKPQSWDFPAFNVADACISVGAGLLFILLWTTKPDDPIGGLASGGTATGEAEGEGGA